MLTEPGSDRSRRTGQPVPRLVEEVRPPAVVCFAQRHRIEVGVDQPVQPLELGRLPPGGVEVRDLVDGKLRLLGRAARDGGPAATRRKVLQQEDVQAGLAIDLGVVATGCEERGLVREALLEPHLALIAEAGGHTLAHLGRL